MASKLILVKLQHTMVMPNYGAAVLKALRKPIRCLPAAPKKMDIQQFGFAGDAVLMDKQLFQKMALKKSSTNLIFRATPKS